ncbi:MAG TPA: hypothetical protein DCP92_00715 [Nitrospiraceae bacterium]|nr:hypothetical protein [Nitrospiraceae bacterium]
MHQTRELICQYLKGSPDGALCGVVDNLIRCMEDADIRVCMSRHHEACSYYVFSLRRTVAEAMEPDIAAGNL